MKKWSTKDLNETTVLDLIKRLQQQTGVWAMLCDVEQAIHRVISIDVPDKVILAKLRSLGRRGKITGCTCGCYGGFEVVE